MLRQSLAHRGGVAIRPSHLITRSISLQSQSVYPFKVPPWRPGSILDDWAERDVRPVSLRQLLFFGRALTEARLLSAANYVRTELPTRIAHRLREMQKLPYVVVTNPRLSHVYELYYTAFERLRKVPEIKTLDDNDHYCEVLKKTLREHLTAIPSLMMGVLESHYRPSLLGPRIFDLEWAFL
ncbi:Branched-chain alpha-ketoacid dehydrogenase kinase/Pyruvate dehydrogenase kinase [Ascosphaera apis ARSEF 7405]|uniref:Protein-serine/threonine kinase n=1 Tax=Ascosphaera apis ARSEF 7405 TaxID=392613 RepID=A0A168DRM6_9EURO|nr:Branched-chain alpha-ketoacid dehydrogenase kinase/Pyruvate dehydrogenase kinase [Ascosphaera apis ARSEF 7405]